MSALPPIDAAFVPAEIRGGNAQAKRAYQEALGFEDVLVQQLTKQLASTVTSPGDGSGGDGSDGGGAGAGGGGILGSDPGANALAGLIPTALTSSLMSGGGVGVAERIAKAIDPAIGTPQGSATPASSPKSK